MELYILRHGTTNWNKTSHLQGSTDIPLDEEGIKLARDTGEGLKDTHFDVVYSSPLSRAVETAKLVLGDRNLPIIKDARISEINFGDWEGLDCSADSTEIPQGGVDRFFDLTKEAIRPPHGESVNDVIKRTHDFYEEITQKPEYKDARILISMHGGAGRALMHSVWQDDDFWHGCVPPNCSVTIVNIKDGKVTDVKKDCIFYNKGDVKYYYKW